MIEIDNKRFTQIGMFCFLVIGISHIANFFIFYSTNNIWSKIGGIAGIIFDFGTVAFFYYLYKTFATIKPEVDPKAIDDFKVAMEVLKKE